MFDNYFKKGKEFIEKIKQYKNKSFFKDAKLTDVFFVVLIAYIFFQFPNIKFIYESNTIALNFIIPLLLVFWWIGARMNLNKNNLLSTASIIVAVFVFLFSVAINDDSKIKLLSNLNSYNCKVAQDILDLNKKPSLSSNFTLNYFITQPYLDNASFIIQRLGTTTGTLLLTSGYAVQGANTLLDQVQSLNIQGSNPLFGSFVAEPIKMYNAQLITIASNASSVFCDQLFK